MLLFVVFASTKLKTQEPPVSALADVKQEEELDVLVEDVDEADDEDVGSSTPSSSPF